MRSRCNLVAAIPLLVLLVAACGGAALSGSENMAVGSDPTLIAASQVLDQALATATPQPVAVIAATAIAATLTSLPTATSTLMPTPTYTPTPLPLTYPTIAYGFETLKGEGWTKFEQIVISATVEWTGTVTHMPMFSTEVSVDVGQDNAWRDVSLEFKDKQQREQLKTGDSIRFRAMVRQVNVVWWSRRFEVRLADVELLYIRHKAVDD